MKCAVICCLRFVETEAKIRCFQQKTTGLVAAYPNGRHGDDPANPFKLKSDTVGIASAQLLERFFFNMLDALADQVLCRDVLVNILRSDFRPHGPFMKHHLKVGEIQVNFVKGALCISFGNVLTYGSDHTEQLFWDV